jgi:ParB/RepB/Spo0J family partition protein
MNTKTSPKLGADATVLEVFKVTARSVVAGKNADDHADNFLRQAGFVERKYVAGRVTGRIPGGNIEFFLRVAGSGKKGEACTLVRRNGNFVEIDSGKILSFRPIAGANDMEIECQGERLLSWNFLCTSSKEKIGAVDAAPAPTKPPIPDDEDDEPTPPPRKPNLHNGGIRLQTHNFAQRQKLGLPEPKRVFVELPPPKHEITVPQRIVTPTSVQSVNGLPPAEEKMIFVKVSECVPFQGSPEEGISGQPRKTFNESDLNELAESIRMDGQLMPAFVRPITHIPGKKWEIIAGERRWRALQRVPFDYMRAVVKNPRNKVAQHDLSLIENFHRKDPPTIELSDALQEHIALGENVVSLSVRYGIKAPVIRKILLLQKLHSELKARVSESVPPEIRIRPSEAAELIKVDLEKQVEFWNEAKEIKPRRLVAAKIRELRAASGKDNSYTRKQDSIRGIQRRFEIVRKAIAELKLSTVEAWKAYATTRGYEGVGVDMSQLNEDKNEIELIRSAMSRARTHVKMSQEN